jgi:hypothetical protein
MNSNGRLSVGAWLRMHAKTKDSLAVDVANLGGVVAQDTKCSFRERAGRVQTGCARG